MKILVTFTGDISGSSQSWGTHIRQAIYLQIVDLTDKKKKKKCAKTVSMMEICVQQKMTENNSVLLPTLAFNYLKTYNHQRSSAFYIIKISPWWSTDWQTRLWEVERIYRNPPMREMWKEIMREPNVGGKVEQCREGPKAKLEQFLI